MCIDFAQNAFGQSDYRVACQETYDNYCFFPTTVGQDGKQPYYISETTSIVACWADSVLSFLESPSA